MKFCGQFTCDMLSVVIVAGIGGEDFPFAVMSITQYWKHCRLVDMAVVVCSYCNPLSVIKLKHKCDIITPLYSNISS